MGKDMHLINIYLKIHNKQTITLDDLRYLAKYSPECFEKTCKNLVYNKPEAKPIMEPIIEPAVEVEQNTETYSKVHIDAVLDKLKLMDVNELPLPNIEANDVKNLLGNLYMEILFPHNDRDTSLYVTNEDVRPMFDRKA